MPPRSYAGALGALGRGIVRFMPPFMKVLTVVGTAAMIWVGGQIVIRPMMYLALSYDHRIVDGKEAVTFLVRVKDSLEDPERLVLDL